MCVVGKENRESIGRERHVKIGRVSKEHEIGFFIVGLLNRFALVKRLPTDVEGTVNGELNVDVSAMGFEFRVVRAGVVVGDDDEEVVALKFMRADRKRFEVR